MVAHPLSDLLCAGYAARMTVSNPQYVVIGIFVAYMVIVATLWKVNKVDYATIGDSTRNIQRGIVVPIGVGAVVLAIATTALGAWHDVLFEPERSGPAWALAVPVLFVAVAVFNTSLVDFRSPNATALPWLALGTLFVGFAEEVVTRGLLVVGLREAGWSPVTVYLMSTALFSILHAINALFGQSMKVTLTQMVMTILAGTALYITRLTTGTLVVGILAHALWDFGTLGITTTKSQQKPLGGLVAMVMFALSMVAIWFVL